MCSSFYSSISCDCSVYMAIYTGTLTVYVDVSAFSGERGEGVFEVVSFCQLVFRLCSTLSRFSRCSPSLPYYLSLSLSESE